MIKTIKDVISDCGENDSDIILGSGFSNGMPDPSTRDTAIELVYPALINKVTTNIQNPRLASLISKNKNDTDNLEYYIKVMSDSLTSIPFINGTDYLTTTKFLDTDLLQDSNELKNLILDTLQQIHPNTWTPYSERIQNCANNLTKFRRIYTLNYDLILYWTFLQHNSSFEKQFIDGFSNKNSSSQNLLTYSDSNNLANILYLHGAIHFVSDKKGDTHKIIKSSGDLYINLIDLIQQLKTDYLIPDYQNLVVLEGTREKKIEIISKNSYLHKCLQRLRNNTNNLIIYGCSIIDDNGNLNNDSHIWEAVIHSSFKKLYIGQHLDKDFSEANFNSRKQRILKALETICDIEKIKSKIEFFTTNDDDIWAPTKKS